MSDGYKRSVYCQAEAEYAFQCKRRLIPLIVRQAYRPDGWLGLLLGSRIYVDFGKFDFKTGCESLLNEITLQRKSQLHVEKDHEQTTSYVGTADSHKVQPLKKYTERNTSNSTYQSIPVANWTNRDVLDFLCEALLYLMMPLCESLSGRGLKRLFRMCRKRPMEVYNQLTEELRSRFDELLPLGIFTQFLAEVDQIIHPITSSSMNTMKSDASTPVHTPMTSSKSSLKDDTNKSIHRTLQKARSP